MSIFLGIDGGGSKTQFALINSQGQLLAHHQAGSAYYLEIGLQALEDLLRTGTDAVLAQAALVPAKVAGAFLGLPAYGEDSALTQRLDEVPRRALGGVPYRCDNDMVCAWAGALGGAEGINVVAGTGSIAYGEFADRHARAGGWGELFSDEGSAHWIARAGLALFSRMSDARAPRGALYGILRRHFRLSNDLDLCAAVYGQGPATRSAIAQLAPLVSEAARAGDEAARAIFRSGAEELADLVRAVRVQLSVPAELALKVSYSGSLFSLKDLVVDPFRGALERGGAAFECVAPVLPPALGAALYAAKLHGNPLPPSAVQALMRV
jgi:N-acetylglucosamine kinase-like BadF-type ATPase